MAHLRPTLTDIAVVARATNTSHKAMHMGLTGNSVSSSDTSAIPSPSHDCSSQHGLHLQAHHRPKLSNDFTWSPERGIAFGSVVAQNRSYSMFGSLKPKTGSQPAQRVTDIGRPTFDFASEPSAKHQAREMPVGPKENKLKSEVQRLEQETNKQFRELTRLRNTLESITKDAALQKERFEEQKRINELRRQQDAANTKKESQKEREKAVQLATSALYPELRQELEDATKKLQTREQQNQREKEQYRLQLESAKKGFNNDRERMMAEKKLLIDRNAKHVGEINAVECAHNSKISEMSIEISRAHRGFQQRKVQRSTYQDLKLQTAVLVHKQSRTFQSRLVNLLGSIGKDMDGRIARGQTDTAATEAFEEYRKVLLQFVRDLMRAEYARGRTLHELRDCIRCTRFAFNRKVNDISWEVAKIETLPHQRHLSILSTQSKDILRQLNIPKETAENRSDTVTNRAMLRKSLDETNASIGFYKGLFRTHWLVNRIRTLEALQDQSFMEKADKVFPLRSKYSWVTLLKERAHLSGRDISASQLIPYYNANNVVTSSRTRLDVLHLQRMACLQALGQHGDVEAKFDETIRDELRLLVNQRVDWVRGTNSSLHITRRNRQKLFSRASGTTIETSFMPVAARRSSKAIRVRKLKEQKSKTTNSTPDASKGTEYHPTVSATSSSERRVSSKSTSPATTTPVAQSNVTTFNVTTPPVTTPLIATTPTARVSPRQRDIRRKPKTRSDSKTHSPFGTAETSVKPSTSKDTVGKPLIPAFGVASPAAKTLLSDLMNFKATKARQAVHSQNHFTDLLPQDSVKTTFQATHEAMDSSLLLATYTAVGAKHSSRYHDDELSGLSKAPPYSSEPPMANTNQSEVNPHNATDCHDPNSDIAPVEAQSDRESEDIADVGCTGPDIDASVSESTVATSNESIQPDFQIPKDVLQKAIAASTTSEPTFWDYRMFKDTLGQSPVVYYCTSFETAEAKAAEFLSESIVGFDLEWELNSQAGKDSIKRSVSLIQLASESKIGLFHISLFKGNTAKDLMPPTLRKILECANTIKAGVNVAGDLRRVNICFDLEMCGTFELSHLYKVVVYGGMQPEKVDKRLVGLADQIQHILRLPLSKGAVRTSPWSRRLNSQQAAYAATDAYAGFQLFCDLERMRKEMDPMPPRPAHYEAKQLLVLGDGTVVKPRTKSTKTAVTSEAQEADEEVDENDEFFDAVESQDSTDSIIDSVTEPASVSTISAAEEAPSNDAATAGLAKDEAPPRQQKAFRLPSVEVERANAWIIDWRATLDDRKPPRVGDPSLRTYHLWHTQGLDMNTTASLLRNPPLALTTVASYIVEAVSKANLPYDAERLQEPFRILPNSVHGKYRGLLSKLGL